MKRLNVDLGEDSYDIVFEKDFSALPDAMKQIHASEKVLIVTDSNVAALYEAELHSLLVSAGYDTDTYIIAAGEENKHMDTILGICAACMEHHLDRKSMMIALGGGVVGDMAGFAAGIYMRGIDFIQIPTTLLSQSDSSVGGKTGVDFGGSKNILGVFHQPKLVYINVSTLNTLLQTEFISGMGEVIKHGIIRDNQFFTYLAQNVEMIKSLDPDILIQMANTNCAIKAEVVMQDEHENGLRAILNFGHTIGHAVESAFQFKMTHGACVGLGMCAAAYISYCRGMLSKEELHAIEHILEQYELQTKTKLPPFEEIFAYMQNDKKKIAGTLKFVLPTGIGSVVQVTDVSKEEIYNALTYIHQ